MIWRIVGLAILVVGVILVVLGFQAADSPLQELQRDFTGRYSDETITYWIIGAIAIVVGGGLGLFGDRLQRKRP
jgi:hypothetical protein